jgi:hypothetical protein
MDLHPGTRIVIVNEGSRFFDRDPRILEADIVACFSRPDDVDGDWFNCRAGQHDPAAAALRVRDEGVTWSRDTSAAGRESLLAAFMLEWSA